MMNLKIATLLLSSSLLAACVKPHQELCYDPALWPLNSTTCGSDDGGSYLVSKPVKDTPDDNGGGSDGNGGDTPDPDDDNGGPTKDDHGPSDDTNGGVSDNTSDSNGDNSDGNNGHGNDDDHDDDSNPGKGKGITK